MNIKPAFAALLQPTANAAENKNISIENVAIFLWIIAIFASMWTHELWRDETREFLIATETNSFKEYFDFAKYDGHPLLWRTILMVLHWLVPHQLVLATGSFIVGLAFVFIFVKYSPFPLLFRVLFIFGIVPFSVNTVDARDYGVSMLLFFILAACYPQSKRHPVLMGVLLFLQANSNLYGMYLSGLFLACWIVDSGITLLKEDKRYIAAAAIALAGIAISYYSTRFDAESVFIKPEKFASIDYWKAAAKAVRHPGEYIWYILNVPPLVRDIFVIGLIIGLLVISPYFGITLWVAITFFNFVGAAFIYPQTRHQGVLYGFIIALYWIALSDILSKKKQGVFKHASIIFFFILYIFLMPFLVHEIKINNDIVIQEAEVEKSTALAAGNYLRTNSQLERAIIIGTPDYALEPIAFYSGNRMYLVQEELFRDFVNFSRKFEKTNSLMQLLNAAKKINAERKVPVIIIIGYFGLKEGVTIPTIYRGNFNIKEVDTFKAETVKLVEFNRSLGDENYQLFLYLPKDELEAYKKKYMELR